MNQKEGNGKAKKDGKEIIIIITINYKQNFAQINRY